MLVLHLLLYLLQLIITKSYHSRPFSEAKETSEKEVLLLSKDQEISTIMQKLIKEIQI